MRPIAIFLLCLLFTNFALATDPARTDDPQLATGLVPYTAFGGARENINYSTGNLNVSIPVISLPQRGGRSFDLSLIYDSKIWQLIANVDYIIFTDGWRSRSISYGWTEETAGYPVGRYGWRWSIPYLYTYLKPILNCYDNYVVILPDGSKHAFKANAVNASCPTVTAELDSRMIRLDATPADHTSVYLSDGTELYFPKSGGLASKIIDRNGNVINITSTASGFTVTDTLGRVITVTGSSLIYKNSNGITQSVNLGFNTNTIAPNFYKPQPYCDVPGTCSEKADQAFVDQPQSQSVPMLESVTLPGGLGTYHFRYNEFGEMKAIKYPTGGWTAYEFGGPGDIQDPPDPFYFHWMGVSDAATDADAREIKSRTVCSDPSSFDTGSCPSGSSAQTTYVPVSGSSAVNAAVTVTYPAPDRSVSYFEFNGNGRTSVKEVRESDGTVLRRTTTDYLTNDCNTQGQGNKNLPSSETTRLGSSGPSSKVVYSYDTISDPNCSTGYPVDTPTRIDEYGYQNELLRRTITTYKTNYRDYNYIFGLQASKTIQDGSGNPAAMSTYSYDGLALTTYGGILDPASHLDRHLGNLTSTQNWRNTDGAWLETLTYYDEVGNVVRSRDPGGHETYLSFTPETGQFAAWGDSSCAAAALPFSAPFKVTRTGSSPVSGNPGRSGTVVTTYSYDGFDRLNGKSYSAYGNAVSYEYDTGANAIGSRTKMTDASGQTTWTYTAAGRVQSESRTIAGVSRTIAYAYYADGTQSQVTYPSGLTVSYDFDGAGRVAKAYTGSTVYAEVFSGCSSGNGYSSAGAIQCMHNNGVITVENAYNNRMQPAVLSARTVAGTIMSLSYTFSSNNNNNGNVLAITNNLDTNRSQSFEYDGLNRLRRASSNGSEWGEAYRIDAWGNLTHGDGIAGKMNHQDISNDVNVHNQILTASYDGAGNTLQAGFTYDAENRLTTGGGETYQYDADGKRVRKVSGGKLYWTGAGSDDLEETDASGTATSDYIFFGGRRIARIDYSGGVPSGTFYYFSDHLGTSRVITTASGTVCYDADYYPYGSEQHVYVNNCPQNYKFTGKERDNETGLDNFEERYFESNMGRFLSPDPEQTSGFLYPDDPQSWSGYAYARNNPLTMIDPDGMAYCTKGDNRTDAGSQEACEKDGGTWNHEAGDQQEVQNDSGDTDTVETPATEVTVEADPDTGAETVTFTNYYFMEREIPLTPEQRMIFTLAYQRSVHDLGCVGMGWAVQEGSHVASAPLFNKPFSAGGTSGTSAASKMSGGLKATKSVRTPVGIPGTGNFAMRRTVNLGRAAGRYLPYIGTAVGAGYAGYCLGQKL